MRKIKLTTIIVTLVIAGFTTSCEDKDNGPEVKITLVTPPSSDKSIKGFYLLNEGGDGSNKSTLDYYAAATGEYFHNIYPIKNPEVVKELGSVGNDMKIYGSKLYAVINKSNKVEVMDVNSGKRITQINIDECRYLAFNKGKVYVSSFAGSNGLGTVYEIDTINFQTSRQVTVGYQPEETRNSQ